MGKPVQQSDKKFYYEDMEQLQSNRWIHPTLKNRTSTHHWANPTNRYVPLRSCTTFCISRTPLLYSCTTAAAVTSVELNDLPLCECVRPCALPDLSTNPLGECSSVFYANFFPQLPCLSLFVSSPPSLLLTQWPSENPNPHYGSMDEILLWDQWLR